MAGVKIRIHPLFFAFGLYFALVGKVFYFLAFAFTAVIHEYGHSFASEKLGYKLNVVTLMPYGAVISGDLSGLKYKDECKIAVAGPLVNAAVVFITVSLWWFIPDVYPYTELIVTANALIAVINLLPAYPLDGGRFLYATLCLRLKRKTALKIVKIIGVVFSALIFAAFVYSCFTEINFTILFFSLFAFIGAVSDSDKNRYVKAYSDLTFKIDKPKQIKKLAVNGDSEVKTLYSLIDYNCYYEVCVFENNKKIAVISGKKLYDVISTASGYEKIKNVI